MRLRKVKKERVTIIKFGVNERSCDGASSGQVESVSYSSKSSSSYTHECAHTCTHNTWWIVST